MYSLLEDKSEQDSPSEDYEGLLSGSFTPPQKGSRLRSLWVLVILAPVVSFGLFGLGVWVGVRWLANPNDVCPHHVQHYCKLAWSIESAFQLKLCTAPVLKEVDTSLHTVVFNGSFMHENVFRQDAGPEVDAAWNSLGVGCERL